MKRSFINRCIAIAIIIFPLLLATASDGSSQTNRTNKELPLRELLKAPGKLVSQAKADRPGSDLKLTGYRVEELQLPRSLTVEVRGQQVAVDKAWRVTVQGGPFPVRAISYGEDKDDRRSLSQAIQLRREGENQ